MPEANQNESAWKMEDVDLFSTSPHGENPITSIEQLDQIVENFNRFCAAPEGWEGIHYDPAAFRLPTLPADLGIGHDDEQETLKQLLERTDLLAGGWVTKLWRDGDHLRCDIERIPDSIAEAVIRGELRTCSAEFNPDFEGTPYRAGYGPALRRVALLGSTPPRKKDLDPLPMPTQLGFFGESRRRVFHTFAEQPVRTTNGTAKLSPERRAQLLKMTPWGRQHLRKESGGGHYTH